MGQPEHEIVINHTHAQAEESNVPGWPAPGPEVAVARGWSREGTQRFRAEQSHVLQTVFSKRDTQRPTCQAPVLVSHDGSKLLEPQVEDGAGVANK